MSLPKPFFETHNCKTDVKKINEKELDKIIKEMVEISKENIKIEEEISKEDDDKIDMQL